MEKSVDYSNPINFYTTYFKFICYRLHPGLGFIDLHFSDHDDLFCKFLHKLVYGAYYQIWLVLG